MSQTMLKKRKLSMHYLITVVWITRFACPKSAKDEVKKPEGPPMRLLVASFGLFDGYTKKFAESNVAFINGDGDCANNDGLNHCDKVLMMTMMQVVPILSGS